MMTSSEGPIFSLASGPPNPKPTTEYQDQKGQEIMIWSVMQTRYGQFSLT